MRVKPRSSPRKSSSRKEDTGTNSSVSIHEIDEDVPTTTADGDGQHTSQVNVEVLETEIEIEPTTADGDDQHTSQVNVEEMEQEIDMYVIVFIDDFIH